MGILSVLVHSSRRIHGKRGKFRSGHVAPETLVVSLKVARQTIFEAQVLQITPLPNGERGAI